MQAYPKVQLFLSTLVIIKEISMKRYGPDLNSLLLLSPDKLMIILKAGKQVYFLSNESQFRAWGRSEVNTDFIVTPLERFVSREEQITGFSIISNNLGNYGLK